ncbi:hypothetical protein TNIN_131181 [Trichonephila inaurata madagascariensis]|uniref:Uncharacterized protein n=1 Tax=Trichonephila inaurata madagascariensis TaxID=2747483 RepID=A0A8X6MFU0_9ARAC|nr:hypothetical protein TNIN_131181 [Trichonephila inaurata madagascariensis]
MTDPEIRSLVVQSKKETMEQKESLVSKIQTPCTEPDCSDHTPAPFPSIAKKSTKKTHKFKKRKAKKEFLG